jgi:hypothetical protein
MSVTEPASQEIANALSINYTLQFFLFFGQFLESLNSGDEKPLVI